MHYVTAKEFSKVIGALGLSNKDAKKGILHSDDIDGFKHTAFEDENGVYIGDIQYDGINSPSHHIADKYIELLNS